MTLTAWVSLFFPLPPVELWLFFQGPIQKYIHQVQELMFWVITLDSVLEIQGLSRKHRSCLDYSLSGGEAGWENAHFQYKLEKKMDVNTGTFRGGSQPRKERRQGLCCQISLEQSISTQSAHLAFHTTPSQHSSWPLLKVSLLVCPRMWGPLSGALGHSALCSLWLARGLAHSRWSVNVTQGKNG